MVVHYEKSIIYKLCCKDPIITDIYIGSTTCFTRRKNQHKSCCTNENDKAYNYNVYKFIREHGNWFNWVMVQVEAYNAENKRGLETRERYWIEELKSTLNKNIPTQNYIEYNQNNKEKIAKYYQNNKEKIDDKRSKKVICECGSKVRKDTLTRHKKSKKHTDGIILK
jgi:hypothetical protein